jgi:hypothetical protein
MVLSLTIVIFYRICRIELQGLHKKVFITHDRHFLQDMQDRKRFSFNSIHRAFIGAISRKVFPTAENSSLSDEAAGRQNLPLQWMRRSFSVEKETSQKKFQP